MDNVYRSNYVRGEASGGNDGQPRVRSLLMNRQIARNLLCLLRSSVCLLNCFVVNIIINGQKGRNLPLDLSFSFQLWNYCQHRVGAL